MEESHSKQVGKILGVTSTMTIFQSISLVLLTFNSFLTHQAEFILYFHL